MKKIYLLSVFLDMAFSVNAQMTDSLSMVPNTRFNGRNEMAGALSGTLSGLYVNEMSGMPGEGGYMNIGGVHTLVADNSPLIVVNGLPYFSNRNVSDVFTGYMRDALATIIPANVSSVTILKGADAAQWGALGSNGVILIQTRQATSDNLGTRISFSGQYGSNFRKRSIPMLNAASYRNYLQDIGMTRYNSMTQLVNDYPFLGMGSAHYGYLFNEDNDWMKAIQRNGFTTENVVRVEGGDAIAKYNISFGYNKNNGTLRGTSTDKYHALISADILASRSVDIFTNVGLAYMRSHLLPTGMNVEQSPIISAYRNLPLVSAYSKDNDGTTMNTLAGYNAWNVNSNPTYPYDNASNPMAIVNTVDGQDKIYDANAQIGANFKVTHDLTLTALTGLYYNYTEETMFVPGLTNATILPQLYSTGLNKVVNGVVRQTVFNALVQARYNHVFNKTHTLGAVLRARLTTRSQEQDVSEGYNTANDNTTTLDKTNDGQRTYGANTDWRYMGIDLMGKYAYKGMLSVNAGVVADGASVTGADAARLNLFPSASATFMAGGVKILPEWMDCLNVTIGASMSGNARFSSNYGQKYYVSRKLFNIGTISYEQLSNTYLGMERKRQLDLKFDFGFGHGLFDITADFYTAHNYDLLVNRDISEVYGAKVYYDNAAVVNNSGIDVSLSVTPVKTRNLTLRLSAKASVLKSTVKDLGGSNMLLTSYTEYNNDDAVTAMVVGASPYQFYGYETRGVYATTAEAEAANLRNANGEKYRAGDVIFVDRNGDGVIDSDDKTVLGSSLPKVFGSASLYLRYKQWSVTAGFGWRSGNKLYNASRRMLMSMSTFYNQSTAVEQRWQSEGQITNVPRADYGDPMGNNNFSDRWIEKGDYFKLRDIKLCYSFGKLFGVVRSGEMYVSAENLFCLTNYLGSDPEFSYSYDEALQGFDYSKLPVPITVKVGFNLNF